MKKGVSLIVLIITIVVVVILALAVILTMQGNNPINNAKISNTIAHKDTIESMILTYVGAVKSQTIGLYDTEEILFGKRPEGEGVDTYRIVVKTDGVYDTVTVKKDGKDYTLYKLDPTLFSEKMGEDFPASLISGSSFYIDSIGHAYLVFEKQGSAPTWMTNKYGIMEDKSLKQFVTHKQNATLGEGVTSNL